MLSCVLLQKLSQATKGGTLTLDFPISGSFRPPTLVEQERKTETIVTDNNGSSTITETTVVVTKTEDNVEPKNPMLDMFESSSRKETTITTTTTTSTSNKTEVRIITHMLPTFSYIQIFTKYNVGLAKVTFMLILYFNRVMMFLNFQNLVP